MEFRKFENQYLSTKSGTPVLSKTIVEVDQTGLRATVEKICQGNDCRYPLLALRLLLHVITGIDSNGRIYISARQLSKSLDVHYDTVTKCLKYLRQIEVLRIEK